MRNGLLTSVLSLLCLLPAVLHAQTNPRVAGRRPAPRTSAPAASTSNTTFAGTLDDFKSLVQPISTSLLTWITDIEMLVNASRQYESVTAMNAALADMKMTAIPKIQQDLKTTMNVSYGDAALTRDRHDAMTNASNALSTLAQYQGDPAARALSFWPNQALELVAINEFVQAALQAEVDLRTRIPERRAHAGQAISAISRFPRGEFLTRDLTLAFERIAKSPEGRLTPANAQLAQPVADGFRTALDAAIANTGKAR